MGERRFFTEHREITPEVAFDGGTFSILYLAPSTNGFEIATRHTMRRREPGTKLGEQDSIVAQRRNEPIQYRTRRLRPRQNESVQQLRDRLLARTLPNDKPELKPDQIVMHEDCVELVPGFRALVGPRNVELVDDTIIMDTMPVTFPTLMALHDPNLSPERLYLANSTSTTGIFLTTEEDGSHKLILQNRSDRNAFYGGVLGATAAGHMDAAIQTTKSERGKTEPVTTATVLANEYRELEEELGLTRAAVKAIAVMGLVTDNVQVHSDFIMIGRLNISAEQVAVHVTARATELRPHDDLDFEGRHCVVNADITTIARLLTEMLTPIPPTQEAALVILGYTLLLDQQGSQLAQTWLRQIQSAIKTKHERIRELVTNHSGHAADYKPTLLPAEQGLPTLESELKRLQLD